MRAGVWLRLGVWAIALAGLIDPRTTSVRRPLLDVDVAVPRDDDAAGAHANGALDATATLVADLSRATAADARLRVRAYGDGERLPCAADRPCVVVTSDAVAPRGGLDRQAPLFTVRPTLASVPAQVVLDDVRIGSVLVDGAAVARATLTAVGAAGHTTTVEVGDGGVPTGRRQHTWTDQSSVTLDVPWWPAQAGARQVEVTVTTTAADGTSAPPQRVMAIADVTATPWPVLVVEARPSWAATFARRALEADARFAVDAVATLAPGLATGRGTTTLDDARVARARVVVVGGLDAVSASDVARLDRFLRQRGGTLVLVPDAAITGPIATLVPGRWRRVIAPRASSATDAPTADRGVSLAGLRAGEWLLGSDLARGDVVLATHDGAAVVVSRPVAEGQVIVVGALDAWRFRQTAPAGEATANGAVPSGSSPEAAAYVTAWQGLAAHLARATGAAVDVRVGHTPGDADATIDVQARTMAPRASWSVAARRVCGTDVESLRLWPQARAGHFRGRASWPPSGAVCEVVAAVAEVGEGRASLSAPPRSPGEARRVVARLNAVATTSGGRAAGTGDTAAVARALVALRTAAPIAVPVWPLRAWWWGLAAAAGLAAEWWLRRRAGAR